MQINLSSWILSVLWNVILSFKVIPTVVFAVEKFSYCIFYPLGVLWKPNLNPCKGRIFFYAFWRPEEVSHNSTEFCWMWGVGGPVIQERYDKIVGGLTWTFARLVSSMNDGWRCIGVGDRVQSLQTFWVFHLLQFSQWQELKWRDKLFYSAYDPGKFDCLEWSHRPLRPVVNISPVREIQRLSLYQLRKKFNFDETVNSSSVFGNMTSTIVHFLSY